MRAGQRRSKNVHIEFLLEELSAEAALEAILPKAIVAQNVAPHMEPNRNRSRSFQVFVEGLKACVGEGGLRNQ